MTVICFIQCINESTYLLALYIIMEPSTSRAHAQSPDILLYVPMQLLPWIVSGAIMTTAECREPGSCPLLK